MSECTHTSDHVPLKASGYGSESAIDPSSWGNRLVGMLVAMGNVLLNAQRRASDRRHLEALDAHMLRDMGLDRGDVERELGKWFWEK